jgi:hypothetical protein
MNYIPPPIRRNAGELNRLVEYAHRISRVYRLHVHHYGRGPNSWCDSVYYNKLYYYQQKQGQCIVGQLPALYQLEMNRKGPGLYQYKGWPGDRRTLRTHTARYTPHGLWFPAKKKG